LHLSAEPATAARHAYRPPAPDPAERAGITPTGATPPSRATAVAGVRAMAVA